MAGRDEARRSWREERGSGGELAGSELDDLGAAVDEAALAGGNDEGPGDIRIEEDLAQLGGGGVIESVEHFVHEKETWTLDKGAGKQQADALGGREREATELEAGVHALRRPKHVVKQAGGLQGVADLIEADVGMAEAEVVDDAAGDDLIGSDELDAFAE